MILVLSKEETFLCVLENDNSNACPYREDLHYEKLNDSYSTFSFSVPLFHEETKNLVKENKVVIQDLDGNFLMFTIKDTEIDTYSNLKHVQALNSGLELLGKRIMPQTIQATDVNDILDRYLDGSRWKRGRTDWAGTRTVVIEQVQTAIKAIHDLRSLFDLELQYRVEVRNGKVTNRFVDLVERIGNDTGKRIENAKDLQEIRIKESSTNLFTALIGIGPQQEDGSLMTFADVEWKKSNGDPLDKPLGQAWLGDPEALEKWGIDGVHITGEYVYSRSSDITPTKLLQLTYEQLKKSVEPVETFEIKFADLENVVTGDGEDYSHEKVRKGDTVTVYHYGIDDSTAIQARVIELKRSQSNPLAGELVLGNYRRISLKKSPIIESIQKRLLNYETVLGAQQKAEQAKTSAIDTAATDATSKASTAEQNAKQYTNDQLGNYVDSVTYNQDLSNIQSQIDGNITSWFYAYEPSLTNEPAVNWTTTEDKNTHLGDLFYNPSNGYGYRFALVDGVYQWLDVKDTDVQKALSDAAKAQDIADAKRRTFVNEPVAPYDVGDLWVQGSNGEIMRCQTAKASGQSFSTADWVKASKYTDDTAVENLKIGGRNLIIGSGFTSQPETWNSAKATIVEGNPNSVLVENASTSTFGVITIRNTSIELGVEYTLSFELKTLDTSNLDYNHFMDTDEGNNATLPNFSNINTDGGWHVYTTTFTSTIGRKDCGIMIASRSGSSFEIRKLKLEKGNKPTDWTPAPEDIDADISGLDGRLTTAETNITANADEIQLRATKTALDTTNSNVSGLDTRLTTAEGDISVNAEQISLRVTKTEFDNLKVGARNLLFNSTGKLLGSSGYTVDWGTTPEKVEGKYTIKVSASTSGEVTKASRRFLVKPNTKYSVQALIKGTVNSKGFDIFFLGRAIGSANSYDFIHNMNGVLPTDKLTYLTWTFTTYSTEEEGYIRIDNNGSSDGLVSSVWFSEIKIEEGIKHTTWTPSPEDVDSDISGLNGRLTSAESNITQNAEQIELRVTKSIYDLDINDSTNGLKSRMTSAESSITQNAENIELKVSKDGVISSINQTAETIKIAASKIQIDGTTVFASGYDPSTKETPSGAQSKANTAESNSKTYSENLQTGYSTNPFLGSWGALPSGYAMWNKAPSKESSIVRRGQWSARWNVATNEAGGMYSGATSHALGKVPELDYIVVEIDFYIASATSLKGAGIIVDFEGTTTYKRVLVDLNAELPVYEVGRWYHIRKVVKNPKGYGTWEFLRYYVMANWIGFNGVQDAKDIIFDFVDARSATKEEIDIYNGKPSWDTASSDTSRWKMTGKTTINGGQIEADTVTAVQMNVTELSAIVAKLGKVNAGEITGSSFTTSGTEGTVDIRNDFVHSVKTLDGSTDKTSSRLTSGIVSVKETSSDYTLLRSASYLTSKQLELQGLYSTYTNYKKNGFNGVARNETTLSNYPFSLEFDPYAEGFNLEASNGMAINNQARLTSDSSYFRVLSPNGGSNQIRFASNGEFALYQNGAYRHLFKPDGSKIGGSIEIDNKVWGMSPIDSPQVKISLLMSDVELPEGIEVIIAYEEKFYKATSNIAIFPSNPNVEVINKADGTFTVLSSKACVTDFFIIGERAGYEGTYFTDMELVYGNTDNEQIA